MVAFTLETYIKHSFKSTFKYQNFIQKKNPDIRIVFPSEHHNISEDSNCDSDDSEAGFAKKRYKSDFIIPESSPESTSKEEPAPKQPLPKRRKKRFLSTVCVADRYADFNANKPNKPQSSRKLEFTSPKNNNLQNVSSLLQNLGNKGRGNVISSDVRNLFPLNDLAHSDTEITT